LYRSIIIRTAPWAYVRILLDKERKISLLIPFFEFNMQLYAAHKCVQINSECYEHNKKSRKLVKDRHRNKHTKNPTMEPICLFNSSNVPPNSLQCLHRIPYQRNS